METRFQNLGPLKWHAQILLGFGFENEDILKIHPELDQACPWMTVSPGLGDFKGKKGDAVVLYGHPELNIPRVLLLGAGKREDFTPDDLRRIIASGIKKCRELCLESILLPDIIFRDLPGGKLRCLEEAVFASHLALYRFTGFKSEILNDDPLWLAIGFMDNAASEKGRLYARRGESAASAVCLARNLDNMPANCLYPEILAARAATLANEGGFKCLIMDEEALKKAGMNCLLAVGNGSVHPPRLIVLEYAPQGHENDKPVVLVGKGITFDSGGICLKPAASMFQMKCDMSGAGAVLAAIDCVAREKVDKRIVGLLACAENMPDGTAYRPGDVLTSLSGSTVEVINTDAEGRLVLCDALAYAQKQWNPAFIIDIATLTGACAVALGTGLAGLFSNDENLAEKMLSYGAVTGENLWRMPLWSAYEDELKSQVADVRHTGAREGGAIVAALFLKHFINDKQAWAHLDIAGVDWNSKNTPLCNEGASGFGVRILLELCRGDF